MSPELRRFCPSAERAAKSTLGPRGRPCPTVDGRRILGRTNGSKATLRRALSAPLLVMRPAAEAWRPGRFSGAERHTRLSGPGGRRSKKESPRSSSWCCCCHVLRNDASPSKGNKSFSTESALRQQQEEHESNPPDLLLEVFSLYTTATKAGTQVGADHIAAPPDRHDGDEYFY